MKEKRFEGLKKSDYIIEVDKTFFKEVMLLFGF